MNYRVMLDHAARPDLDVVFDHHMLSDLSRGVYPRMGQTAPKTKLLDQARDNLVHRVLGVGDHQAWHSGKWSLSEEDHPRFMRRQRALDIGAEAIGL